MNIKFDFLGIAELKRSLDDLHAKLDILLSKGHYVSPALEEAIKTNRIWVNRVDQKVPNNKTTTN